MKILALTALPKVYNMYGKKFEDSIHTAIQNSSSEKQFYGMTENVICTENEMQNIKAEIQNLMQDHHDL